MAYTFHNLIIETLQQIKKPLTPKEIWDAAVELGIAGKLNTKGKTPWRTLGAKIYVDMKENPDTHFVQAETSPVRFYLRDLWDVKDIDTAMVEKENDEKSLKIDKGFHERDLHPLLVKAVYSHPHFKCNVKTIKHETSKKTFKGYNEWLHPDLVGIYFPFEDYVQGTLLLQEALKVNPYKMFSFEMKITLNMSNLREYYFQAVSNSSWAHEGYLVALNIDDDILFRDELRRLSNAFGIGVIQLNAECIEESEVLFTAKEREFLDWDTINRLTMENRDFKLFIEDLTEDIKLSKIKSRYDEVLDDARYEQYIRGKGIITS